MAFGHSCSVKEPAAAPSNGADHAQLVKDLEGANYAQFQRFLAELKAEIGRDAAQLSGQLKEWEAGFERNQTAWSEEAIVQRAHVEPGAPQCTVERLIEELRLMASWLGLAGLAIAPVAGIDRLFATLHVGAHPAFAELAPAQSERACYG